MTKANENGNVASRVADDCMNVLRGIDHLLAEATDDLLDGDDDTSRAQKALNLARNKTFDLFAVQSKVARRNLVEAETLAEQAAAGGRQQRGLLPSERLPS